MRANGLGVRCKYEGTCVGGVARAEREALRRREARRARLRAWWADGVSEQPSISDGNAVGNSVQNMIEMLSADRLSCLERESNVR